MECVLIQLFEVGMYRFIYDGANASYLEVPEGGDTGGVTSSVEAQV
jgi:hypothetical protein